ncbi:hypothetical protein ACIBKX_35445, partial [Streptomyces sp. NPDC050658]|uniref:hypothetical protein n=1 Tax=unclassified Streptomyces TaxID=2593676 RepID=UPI00342964DF
GRFPSVFHFVLAVLAFPTLSDSFVSDFLGAFPVPAPASRPSRFPFRRFRLYQKFSAGLTGSEVPIYREWLLVNEIQEASRC